MMVDFHTHILPGVDDGSKSVEQSLEMLRQEWDQGIRCVSSTPHFYADRDNLEAFLHRRNNAAKALRQAMTEDMPRLLLGAEVRFFRGISDCETLEKLTLEGTRYLLVELPPSPWPESLYRELSGIWHKQNLIPIIAHVDRYISPLHNHAVLARLTELPVLIQANGEFFLRKNTAWFARRLLRQGKIHVLGSDCHNLTDRKPNLAAACEVIRQKLGESMLEKIREREKAIFDIPMISRR